jgi:6-phosphogluconolactonase (cycloisomerase 2 family)
MQSPRKFPSIHFVFILLIFSSLVMVTACDSGGTSSSGNGGTVIGNGGGTGGTSGGTGGNNGGGNNGGSGASSQTLLFAAQDGGSGIQSGIVDTNGNITPGPPSDTGAQDMIVSMTSTPDGKFMYTTGVAGSSFGNQLGNNAISMFAVNAQTGVLSPVPGSPMIMPDRVGGLLVTPNAANAYVPENGQWTSFTIDQTTGQLSLLSVGGLSGLVPQDAVSPDGHLLVSAQGSSLFIDTADGGTVTNIPGSPFTVAAANTNVTALAIAANGLLFVATQLSNDTNPPPTTTVAGGITPYSLSTTGQPTALSSAPFQTGQHPFSIAITPDSHYLYVTTQAFGGGNQFVEGYAIGVNGALTPVPGSPVSGNQPLALAVDNVGHFLFATGDSGTTVYTIDASTGALTQVSTSPVPAGVFSTAIP